MFKLFNKFYKPEDGVSTPELTRNDILNELDKLDDEPSNDDKVIKEIPDNEEEIKLKEDEPEVEEEKLELDEKEDEGDDIKEPVKRKDVLKEYPALFKKFPFLDKALYRNKEFSELFSTPQEAREAKERLGNYEELENKANTLDRLESQVLTGDTKPVLQAIKHNDPEAFNRVVDNYLPMLREVDPQAHAHVISNIFREAIMTMKQYASREKDENLDAAADIFNRFFLATTQVTQPVRLSSDKPKEDNKLEQERQQFIQEKFETTRDTLNDRVRNTLKATISDYMDPKNEMTDYVKRNAVNDALEDLLTNIESDSSFGKTLDTLWKKSFEKNFDKESVEQIRKTFLGKAKTMLRSSILKSRNTALKGLGKTNGARRQNEEETPRRTTSLVNRSQSREQVKIKPGMSTFDILNQD